MIASHEQLRPGKGVETMQALFEVFASAGGGVPNEQQHVGRDLDQLIDELIR
jgi:hypothetical protein